jgi:hypothetical protein
MNNSSTKPQNKLENALVASPLPLSSQKGLDKRLHPSTVKRHTLRARSYKQK